MYGVVNTNNDKFIRVHKMSHYKKEITFRKTQQRCKNKITLSIARVIDAITVILH